MFAKLFFIQEIQIDYHHNPIQTDRLTIQNENNQLKKQVDHSVLYE